MKISPRKISSFCALTALPLLVFARANAGSAATAPDQAPSVPSFAGNAQHTAIFQPAAQNLNAIRWTTTIDLNNSGAFAHYGSPLITEANTILVPVKTATDGFQVNAFDASSGAQKYTLTTDYRLPNHGWIPVYNPALATGSSGTRLYYPGRGGTVYHIDNPDAVAHGTPVQDVFYTTLANYQANAAAFNAAVFINTPITSDSHGNIFFGFRVQGTAPAPLSTTQSGFARIDANGNGTYVLAGTAASDASINRDSHNSAPALSNDEATLYVVAKSSSTSAGYLLGLNSTTLVQRYRVFLRDPRNGNAADITDNSTSSPTIGPDNDVYFGLFGDPANGSRGFLLHFNSDLTIEKPPGGFGWDYTCAIVPATMVPSYQGPSTYLIFSKYNNYNFDDGDGVNKIALLDPNATQIDPHSSGKGLAEMREVLTVTGPTPDKNGLSTQYPYAVREWCINTAAVNPATNSVFTPSEDGHIYRWNLASNSLSQTVSLNEGIGEPYVPTIIGPSGMVYTLNGGTLFAVGGLDGVGVTLASSVPDVRTVIVGQSLTFTATVTNTGPSGVIPSGTVTFRDFTYQNLTPVTTTLAPNVPLDANGQATLTTSSLTAGSGFLGNHHITAIYSGDGVFSGGNATLVQKIHALSSTTTVISSPNPSSAGQSVSFTATVASGPPGPTIPSGMVTFREEANVLAQIPVNSSGVASFNTSSLSSGDHHITTVYSSDTVVASSSGNRTQTVVGGPTPTPTSTPGITPTPTVSPGFTPTPTPVPAQALNLSTRMRVQAAENVGIGGFIITGSTPTRVLIRAIGPSLTQSGVPDALADPRLDLQGAGPSGGFNDNWRDTQEVEIIATGIPPSNDLESAMIRTLSPGPYTAIVSGNGKTSGVALVEVYDLDHSGDAKLANISTRAFVATGNNIVIAGFILGNNLGENRVVMRGMGPSLTGILNVLADPSLELRNADGLVLAANNNWQDDPAQAALLMAAGLAPTSKLESGIATTLAPGLYTALLSGVDNGTGVGVVEIYDLEP